MTSIIAMTFLIGITANYAFAADIEIQPITVVDGDGEFHAWEFSGTDATSSLLATLCDDDDSVDPFLVVQSPTFTRENDDAGACDFFLESQVIFQAGEVEDGCWVTQSKSFENEIVGQYTLTLDLQGPGDITPLGTVSGLFSCIDGVPLCESQVLACEVPFLEAQLNCEIQSQIDWMNHENPDDIALQVFAFDPFCIDAEWDDICEAEYVDVCMVPATEQAITCTANTPCEDSTGSLHVLKFHDLNGDGIQDPEEEGIPGWGVSFGCDSGQGGIAPTGEDGLVWFDELDPDLCTVSEETRAGWIPTTEPLVQVEIIPGEETIVEFGNVQVITASKSWTHTDYIWEGNTETDDVLAEELPTDDEGKFVAFAQVHQNGKYTGTNPGAMYALTTIEVLADIDGLWVEEIYDDCTDDGEGILQFVSRKITRNVKVAIADSNDDVTELTDDLYNDVGGSIEATLAQADVHIEQPIEAGSTVYVLVKFKDNPSNIEVDDGEVDVMCNNRENVTADIFDQEVSVSVDASLRITNQE